MIQTNEAVALIEDPQQLMTYLSAWHEARTSALEHLLTLPEGTVIETNEGTLVLEDFNRDIFQFALLTALQLFQTLPFKSDLFDVFATETLH